MGVAAYEEGRDAHSAGIPDDGNPYRRHACREHWLDGWNDQARQALSAYRGEMKTVLGEASR